MQPLESVVCPVRSAARRDPNGRAISHPGGDVSFTELDLEVSKIAANARRLGLSGARVGVYLQKSVTHIALILAFIRSDAVGVQISARILPPEIPAMLHQAGCDALLTDDPEAREAAARDGVRTLGADELLVSDGETSLHEVPRISLAQPATVIFTSGSTGHPKAALHTLGNHYASAVGSSENIALSPGDVWLHSLPLYHVGGLSILFRCAISGATIALLEPDESIGASIQRSGATHVSLVATQLRRLLDEDADLSGVKAILLGGSGIPSDLLDRAHELGLPVHTSYGLTEMASQVTTTAPGASRLELATSGRVLAQRELRISDEGEILVRGATLFAGYVERDRTVRPLDDAGWFHTKDLGSLDSDGLLTVTGRLDNLFVSGGENIQPEEIEESLRRLDGVSDAVVVPVPDEEFGERPVAFVRSDGEMIGDLSPVLRETLPGFKVPVAFHEWPKDAPQGMKVDRAFFRSLAAKLRHHAR